MGAPVRADPLPRALRLAPDAPYRRLVGVGGIGAGLFFASPDARARAQGRQALLARRRGGVETGS